MVKGVWWVSRSKELSSAAARRKHSYIAQSHQVALRFVLQPNTINTSTT